MPLPDIFQLSGKQSVPPNIDLDEFSFNNKSRPLCRVEVKYQQNNEMNCIIGFVEGEIDLVRTSQVVSYINQLYPFLNYAVVYDKAKEWLFYSERPSITYNFSQKDMIEINSTASLNDHILSSCSIASGEQQCFWRVFALNIPEWPMFKFGISLSVSHNLADGLSLCNLITQFNKLYVSNIDLKAKPDPVQLTPFTPSLALPKLVYESIARQLGEKQQQYKMPPVTRIKGDTPHACKPTDTDSYLIHLQPGNFYSKIPDIQCSFTANAVAALVFGAYAYVHGDVKQGEKWTSFALDLRVAKNFYNSERIPDLDLTNTHIGQSYSQYYLFYTGDKSTNLLEVATSFQEKYQKQNGSDYERWRYAFAQLTMRMGADEVRNPSSFFITNLGKVEHGEGPVVQSLNVSPSKMNCNEQQFQLTYAHTAGGKYGCMVAQQRQEGVSEEKQKAIWRVMTRVHEMNREVGPEKVTVEAVIGVMEEEFARIGEK